MKASSNSYSFGLFLIMSLFVIILFPAIIILLSGNILWVEGWILGIWFDVMLTSNMIYMYKKNPALLSERLKAPGSDNQMKWDKYLLTIIFLLGASWLIIMPLDAQRFTWSPYFPLLVKVIGSVLLLLAFYILIRVTIENPYLSTLVRIQSDRKQQVISTGVYDIVRHPQYLGLILTTIGGPLLLGSIIGLAIGIIIFFILMIRIIGEEKMLVEELPGYEDYRKKVNFRLIPFVW